MRSLATVGKTGVDEEAAILLRHDDDALASLTVSLRAATPSDARIVGTGGHIHLPCPWWAVTRLVVRRDGEAEETLELPAPGGGFAPETEAFMAAIRAGAAEVPGMPHAESLAILRTLDALRAEWGVRHPGE